MIPFKFKKEAKGPAPDSRQSLIREETLFLLQGHDARFAKQLQARLLEEGCNLPLSLARPVFYAHVIDVLQAGLGPRARAAFRRRFAEDAQGINHAAFYRAMRFFHGRLAGAEACMAKAATEAVGAVVGAWRLEPAAVIEAPPAFEARVQAAVTWMLTIQPEGRLSAIPLAQILRRLRVALTVSLLRYVRDAKAFRSQFGPIPAVLRNVSTDPVLFSRVMAFCTGHIPYASHLMAQSFWRTLRYLATEKAAHPRAATKTDP